MKKPLNIEEILDLEFVAMADKPLYLQLYQEILQRIISGRMTRGTRLPASRNLAKQLNISRNTVQKCYEQLAAEGYLHSKIGSGIYVAAEIPDTYLNVDVSIPSNPVNRPIRTVASTPKFGDFSPGIPDLELFPHKLWTRTCHKILRHQYQQLLYAKDGYGDLNLRQAIVDYLAQARGMQCNSEQIIITCGSQEAINLAIRTLLQPERSIAIENPGYRGAIYAATSNHATITPIAADEHGINVEILQQQKIAPQLIYVTPSHQYPLGSSLPITRRLELLEYAQQNDSYLIEDDYDSEFHYQVKPLPSLQGLDKYQRVLYVGTFSKMLFPAIRLGFLVVPASLATEFEKMKLYGFGRTTLFNQAVLAEFMQAGHFSRHLRRMRLIYAEKYKVILDACHMHLSEKAQIHAQSVGLHIALSFKNKTDDQKLVSKLNQLELYPAPLSSYYHSAKKQSGLVLGFGNTAVNRIEPGILQIARNL